MKLYLCAVGTSIATSRVPNASEVPSMRTRQNDPWDADPTELQKELDARLLSIDYKNVDVRRKLSAELNSLDRAGVNPDDFVALLATDTLACRVCANKLKKVLIDCYGLKENNVRVTRVEGLQTTDAELMRRKGLNNFVKEALKYIDGSEYAPYEIVLNTTVGFKCVAIFLTVLGMIYRKPSIYLFEFSNELIKLPPLPFTFDFDLFMRMKNALLFLDENVAATEREFLSKIEGYTEEERPLFMTFTEKFDEPNRNDRVTVSPLAFSLVEIEKQAEERPVMIAASALAELDAMTGDSKNNLSRVISYAQSPLWRAAHNHKRFGARKDLIVFKPGATAERFVGYMDDEKLHVVKVYKDHDEYVLGYNASAGLNKEAFANEEFRPWIPVES